MCNDVLLSNYHGVKDKSSTSAQISIQVWVIQRKKTIPAKTHFFYDNKIFFMTIKFFFNSFSRLPIRYNGLVIPLKRSTIPL